MHRACSGVRGRIMPGRVNGKVILVTGVASGIGRSTAIALAREGARLVLGDVAAAGEETVDAACRLGADARFLECDVARQRDVEALVSWAMSRQGRVDAAGERAGSEGARVVRAGCRGVGAVW